jgi:hypothetical protein
MRFPLVHTYTRKEVTFDVPKYYENTMLEIFEVSSR